MEPPAIGEPARVECPPELDSFDRLVEQYQDRIYCFLRRLGVNEHDAEDLTQDTFIKAYRALSRFKPVYSFSTWLFTIAKRTALNHFRDRRPTEPLDEEMTAEHEDPAEILEKQDRRNRIWTLAHRLKPGQYEALWLRYGEGFSVAETARVMGRSELYVRVQLHRARNQLAKLLEGKL